MLISKFSFCASLPRKLGIARVSPFHSVKFKIFMFKLMCKCRDTSWLGSSDNAVYISKGGPLLKSNLLVIVGKFHPLSNRDTEKNHLVSVHWPRIGTGDPSVFWLKIYEIVNISNSSRHSGAGGVKLGFI